MMFMFDIETLGVESTTVILSAAIIYFDPEKDQETTHQEYVDRALFIKFDAEEQVRDYSRTITKSTLDWWEKQGVYQKNASLVPSKEHDVSTIRGIELIRNYITQHNKDGDKLIVWARGSLDQMAIDSLSSKAGVDPIAPFNRWRDVRTAVDLLTGSTNGYCEIEGFSYEDSIKHHPVTDCALDILMLVRGKSVLPEMDMV